MRDYNTKCCMEPCNIPAEFSYMWSEIVADFYKLCKRYKKVVTKRERVLELAEPKYLQTKYREKCICPDVACRKVEILNKTESKVNTRTEQLAFPKPRHLSDLRQRESFNNFCDFRKSEVNRLYRKSLLSIYSHLSNLEPESQSEISHKWDHHTNTNLIKHLKKLSAPKKEFAKTKKKKISRSRDKSPNMRHIRKLSKPKKYVESETNNWTLTKGLKYYKPTERMLNISQPRKYENNEDFQPFCVEPKAITYKASSRIKQLAVPFKNISKVEDKTENPFRTNRRALKAVASKRILELASPRSYFAIHSRTKPFKVPRGALKAKISTRTKELAKPRKCGI